MCDFYPKKTVSVFLSFAMEDESGALNVLAMGESMSIDYGLLIATINSTSVNSNCTVRFKNGCSPREKLQFRFWPGIISFSSFKIMSFKSVFSN